MARRDLERPDLDELDWSAEHRPESLSRVFAHAVGLATLAEILTSDGEPAIATGWATVGLAAAAALVALDRYYGFSAGWMRRRIPLPRRTPRRS